MSSEKLPNLWVSEPGAHAHCFTADTDGKFVEKYCDKSKQSVPHLYIPAERVRELVEKWREVGGRMERIAKFDSYDAAIVCYEMKRAADELEKLIEGSL